MNCRHENQRAYSYAFGRCQTVMCQDCLAAASGTGMLFTLIERRTHDEPHAVERRLLPRWLRNLTNRDETGRSFAA